MQDNHLAQKVVATRLLITNSIIATIGQFLPAVAALFCVPVMLESLGAEGFSAMNLVWVVLGYFAFFDFGLNRAFVQSTSEFISTNRNDQLPALFRFTQRQVILFSLKMIPIVLLGQGLYAYFGKGVKQMPPEVLLIVIVLVTVMLPMVLIVNFYSGGMIALQEQKKLNLLKVIFGVLFFLGPTITSYFTKSLALSVATLAATRLLALLMYRNAFWKVGASFFHGPDHPDFHGKAILSKGVWMFVASIFAPLLTFADRFVLGWYEMSEVAKYAIPFDLVQRLGSLQASVIIVLFPAMSALSYSDVAKARKMVIGVSLGSFVMFCIAYIGVLIGGGWFLDLWLGLEQAKGMNVILPVLMLGLIANMVANVLFNNLQATGKESKVAILQGVELVIMMPMWLILAKHFGAAGLAWGWSIRVFFDLLALASLSKQGDDFVFRFVLHAAVAIVLLAGLYIGFGGGSLLGLVLAICLVLAASAHLWFRFASSSAQRGEA